MIGSAEAFCGFYRGRRVLVTGDTGFKGAWLCHWLRRLGAEVSGIALKPATEPSLYGILELERRIRHVTMDIREGDRIAQWITRERPEIVFHLAAQALVRLSYREPVQTLETNILGTANLLRGIAGAGYSLSTPCMVVTVASDKCYENRETYYGYRETDPLGGHDLYSASKGAMEIVVAAWRRSFWPADRFDAHGVALASARAGNVIGGGDWADDRILPDCARALSCGKAIMVRNPESIRPWQHVLEPLSGYLQLAWEMGRATPPRAEFLSAWNFGPEESSVRTVRDLADLCVKAWGSGQWTHSPQAGAPAETKCLKLAIQKASHLLQWRPVWSFERAVRDSVAWYREAYVSACTPGSMEDLTSRQIDAYTADAAAAGCRWAASN